MPSPAVRGLGLLLFLLLTVHALVARAQSTCPERIRVVYIDAVAEPFFRGVGQAIPEPPGLFVEWARSALEKLGCRPNASFNRLPVGRMASLAGDDANGFDLALGVAQNTPQAAQLRIPAVPTSPETDLSVTQVEVFLYARADDRPDWDGRELKLKPGQSVSAAAKTFSAVIAASRGWPVEAAFSHEAAVRMTLAGRTAAVVAVSAYLDERLARKDRELSGLIRLTPAVLNERFYAAATAHFHRRHPDFVHSFWVEMCRQGNALRAKPLSCPLSALQDS